MTRVRFGAFEVDLDTGELWRDGAVVPLQDLPFRLLAALLERPGHLVSRADLVARLWGSDTFVDSTAGLNTAVAKLRDALGDSADTPALIETVPKRGYRFIGRLDGQDGQEESRRASPSGERPGATASAERRSFVWLAAALAVVAVVAALAYQLRASRSQVRVAVVLFDNETGRSDYDRLAQGLTDATVFALTAQPRLAVVGNAAILRTTRPFRDLSAIHDALHTDFVVIGQVQRVDASVIVRTHLIRSADQAHVWVAVSNLTADGEAALQSAVGARVRDAVAKYATGA